MRGATPVPTNRLGLETKPHPELKIVLTVPVDEGAHALWGATV
jgi:hypothetical protein